MQELGTSKKKIKIAIISDGTGETASAVSSDARYSFLNFNMCAHRDGRFYNNNGIIT